jgi:hypothetical protein
MFFEDQYHPTTENDYDDTRAKVIDDIKSTDPGYCKIFRHVPKSNGKMKLTKIEMYSSGDANSNIRDAVTGKYYCYKVGSKDENFFFKVALSTGECKCKNGSNTFYYSSPEEFYSHLHIKPNAIHIEQWNEKKINYINELKQ